MSNLLVVHLTYGSFISVRTPVVRVCECMCLYDRVVSISSFHIHAGHALSMECVVALQHEIRGSRRYTAALDVRWCAISFF